MCKCIIAQCPQDPKLTHLQNSRLNLSSDIGSVKSQRSQTGCLATSTWQRARLCSPLLLTGLERTASSQPCTLRWTPKLVNERPATRLSKPKTWNDMTYGSSKYHMTYNFKIQQLFVEVLAIHPDQMTPNQLQYGYQPPAWTPTRTFFWSSLSHSLALQDLYQWRVGPSWKPLRWESQAPGENHNSDWCGTS